MKILHVIHGFLPQFRGGTELYVWKLAREQRVLGHDVEIVTGTTDFAPEPKLEDYIHDGFRVWKIVLSGSYLEHWTRSFNPDATALFAEVLRAVRPDLVHVQHWYRLSRNLLETCYRLGVPAVCTLHDLWTSCPRIFRIRNETFCERPLGAESCTGCVPRFPWMEDAATARQIELFRDDFLNEFRLAQRIIVPSRAHGDLVLAMTGLPKDRLLLVPHGTISAAPEAPIGRRIGAASERKERKPATIRLGVWGHLFHMKGAHLLLEALRELDEADRFEVHVWGKVVEPKYKERLERLASGLNVQWYGAFTPEDVAAVPLDLAVMPSMCSESFSFVLDEAFRMGLPAIVAERGALAERIGKAGTTFKAESPSDLARVLRALARDPSQLAAWRAAIPSLTEMPEHARRLNDVYREVIEEAPHQDLDPDMSLPQRRTREMAALVREAEQLMFGYLGEIKREKGRGDHYAATTEKMVADTHEFGKEINDLKDKVKAAEQELVEKRAIVATLAREIADFRDSMVQIHKETPRFDRKLPNVPECKEHVPGLGALSTLIGIDHEIMANFVEATVKLRLAVDGTRKDLRDRDGRLEELAGRKRDADAQLEAARRDLAGREKRLNEAARAVDEREKKAVDLMSRLTDATSRAAIAEAALAEAKAAAAAAESRALKAAEHSLELEAKFKERTSEIEYQKRLVAALGGLADTLRKALAKVTDADPTFHDTSYGLAKDLRDKDLPNLGKLGAAMERTRDTIAAYIAELKKLKKGAAQAVEASAKLEEAQRALAAKDALIAGLAMSIEDMRRALTAVFQPVPRVELDDKSLPAIPDHVPGLGDLETLRKTNRAMIAAHVEELAKLKSDLDRLARG